MREEAERFRQAGYVVRAGLLTSEECAQLLASLPQYESVGSRDLLDYPLVQACVAKLRVSTELSDLLEGMVAVQCTAFIKTQQKNWAVRLHRDRAIPAERGQGWKSSGTKNGLPFVQPPREVLASLVAVRLNLDAAAEGDLQVVPGSHRYSSKSARSAAREIPVPAGGVLVMSPLLEHASTKLKSQLARRVLHFLFGPKELPDGYEWCYAI